LGAGSITYHATNLIITQGLSDITTASGDTFDVEMMTATTCRIKNYISSARGQLLQVVTVAYTTSTSTTSATLVDTGLTASITPKYATSKILVLVDQTVSLASTSTATYVDVAVFRGATDIGRDYRVGGSVPVAFDHRTVSLSIFDSPATTSATTYKTQFASSIAGQSVEAQHANIRPSTITLMEIRQ
jgi:hypothetical protein